MELGDARGDTYVQAINQAMNRYGKRGIQLIFVVLATNKIDLYAAVKKRCYVDFGSK